MKRIEESHLEKLSHRYQVMFAIFCAEQTFYKVEPKHKALFQRAINAAKGFIRGEVSIEECEEIHSDIGVAADFHGLSAYAIGATSWVMDAAIFPYNAAICATHTYDWVLHASKNDKIIIEKLWEYYHELLNLDSNLESIFTANRF